MKTTSKVNSKTSKSHTAFKTEIYAKVLEKNSIIIGILLKV